MKNIRLLLFCIAVLLAGLCIFQVAARERLLSINNQKIFAKTAFYNQIAIADPVDMTDRIVNPSFESSFSGWTNNGMAEQGNDGLDPQRQGNIYIEKWVSAPPLPDVSISQTINNLPNGQYTLMAGAQNISQDPFGGKPGAFIFGNNTQTEVQTKGEYSVTFLVVDGTATIGFKTQNSQGNWAGCDNFRLLYNGFAPEAMQQRLQALIASAELILAKKMSNADRALLQAAVNTAKEPLPQQNAETQLAQRIVQLQNAEKNAGASVDAYEKLQAAIEAARLVYGDGSGQGAATFLTYIDEKQALANNLEAPLSEIQAATVDIETVSLAYRRANASDIAPLEMTGYIVNPGFESSFSGWNNDGLQIQGNNDFGMQKQGDYYAEKWVSAPPLPDVGVSQTITGLPNGKYTLTAGGQNIAQNPLSGQQGAMIFGNTEQKAVTTPGQYSVDFLVIDGTANIGFKTANSQGNWAACDNFRLAFKGFAKDAMQEKLQALIDSAEILLAKKMRNSERTALESALTSAGQPLPEADPDNVLTQRIVSLQDALVAARISVNAYSKLEQALALANAAYGDGTGNAAAALKEVIDTNRALADNLDAALEDIISAPEAINAAILAFRIANASGPAPVVVTDPRFVRGATMAFGRSSISGTTMADLHEHGFCYSVNPNPTIFDQKTTKTFSNNGFIYRMENLQPATVYYARAYAVGRNYAVGYGDVIKIITIPKGHVTYTLQGSVTDGGENFPRIASAMESAVSYYNNLTSISGHHLSVNYHPGTPTAEASYGGYMQFGQNPSYQRTGTAMHEMNHTIGVGQHWVWYGPSSPLRAEGSRGKWLGERANKVVQFLENDANAFMTGDGVHMWPYGINGAHEDNGSEFLYTAHALVTQGLGEDGLPPSGGFASPAYSFDFDATAKYYIKTEDENLGLQNAFLVENELGHLANKAISPADALSDDHAAWYFQFNPATGYYQIRNAATGKLFTYAGTAENGIALTQPNASPVQSFQLMGARYDTYLGDEQKHFYAKAYWIVSPQQNMSPPTLAAITNHMTAAEDFNLTDDAKSQRWLLLAKEQVESFQDLIAVPTEVENIHVASGDARIVLTWNAAFGVSYDILRSQTAGGTFQNIASNLSTPRFVDSVTNGQSYFYKIIAHNDLGASPEPTMVSGTPVKGQHVHISFDENTGTKAYDDWGGYHAQLKNGVNWMEGDQNINARTAESKPGNGGVALSKTAGSYIQLEPGLISTLTNFTLATWVRLPENLDDYARLFDFGTGTEAFMALAPKAGAEIFFQIKNQTAEYTRWVPYTIPKDKWVHLAITLNATTFKLFVNGMEIYTDDQATIKPADLGVTTLNYLGRSQWGHDPYSDLAYEDFSIYNYALSGQQIAALTQDTPLPVRLISFEGKASDQGNLLVWHTSEELNNDHFIVERALNSPNNFQAIAKIKGNGTTSQENKYQFLDKEANGGIFYYRLKQLDLDGQMALSRIIAIDNRILRILRAYPNPCFDLVTIELPRQSAASFDIRVYSTGGLLILEDKKYTSNDGTVSLRLKALPTGIYQIQLVNAEGSYLARIIKE